MAARLLPIIVVLLTILAQVQAISFNFTVRDSGKRCFSELLSKQSTTQPRPRLSIFALNQTPRTMK